MWNTRLNESQAGIQLPGKYQQPQICKWYHSNGRKWRGTKEPFDEGERGEWKSWLKTQHWKNKNYGPITSWQIDGETTETVSDFILGGSKITADCHCSHEIKRCLLLGEKDMTNLDSILKSRDNIADKGPSSQSYGFSSSHVLIWELDHKKAWTPQFEHFQIVVLEEVLESPLD